MKQVLPSLNPIASNYSKFIVFKSEQFLKRDKLQT